MESDSRDLLYIKLFTGFIVFVFVIIILKELRHIFIPLFLSLLLYFLFNGVVKRLSRFIPKFFVLSFLLVFIFIIFYFFGVLIASGVSSFIGKFPTYSGKIIDLIKSLFEQLKIPISEVENYLNNFDWTNSFNTSYITRFVSTTFGSIASYVGNLALVLLFLMFMLAGRGALLGRVDKAFTRTRADDIKFVVNSIENQVQHYLLIKIFVSLLTASIGGLIIWWGGIDFVIFFSLLIFFLNFIPNIGSVIATVFPILIGLIKHGFSLRILVVAIGLMGTQFIIGNVVEPKICGKNLNLSPIVILISLIFWGWTWGIVGMILAVPLTSAMKIMFQHIDVLKPLAELISSE